MPPKKKIAGPPKPDPRIAAGQELLRAVQILENEKGIQAETVFTAIERAVRLAIEKFHGDEEDIKVEIDRQSGIIVAEKGGKVLDPHSGELGRIAAQAAKQQMIQMFREEESNSLVERWERRKGELVQGTVQRFEGGKAVVALSDKSEAILPRGEQIPGESYHVSDKVKAVVLDVKKQAHRVQIVLSRSSPEFVRRLFEKEIPEIYDGTITIKNVAREAGHRSKVAVSSIDNKVDCVGACVGVRGSRIKNIVEVLGGGERIDIVRWNDALQVLIPAALQPANVDEVFLYPRLERAVVLVKEDQLSLAIGRKGQNVRLASKLVDYELEIMTHDELAASVDKAEAWFRALPGMTDEGVEALLEEGFLSYSDVAVLEAHELSGMTGMNEDDAEEALIVAEEQAEEQEKDARQAKTREPGAAAGALARGRLIPEAAAEPPMSEARQKFDSLFADTAPPSQPDEDLPEGAAPETAFEGADQGYGEPPPIESWPEETQLQEFPGAEAGEGFTPQESLEPGPAEPVEVFEPAPSDLHREPEETQPVPPVSEVPPAHPPES
jgi:N utilization substance protein A